MNISSVGRFFTKQSTFALIGGALTALLAVAPAANGAPAITVTTASTTVSDTQAGGHATATNAATYNYSNTTEDIKTAITAFAPGLLGNPESVPKCPEANLQANTCPANTVIGSTSSILGLNGTNIPLPAIPGTFYNMEPLGNEPGRLGARTITGTTASIPFTLKPRSSGGGYGLTGTLTDIPRFDTELSQVLGLSFTIDGAANSYTRNPTSCEVATSTGQAIGYDDTTPVEAPVGPAAMFTPTNCGALPFNPGISVSLGKAGQNGLLGYPPITVKVTNTNGAADIKGNTLLLPIELNSNNTAYKTCSQAQADSDSCPANSQFGTTKARSSYIKDELSGPAYLIQATKGALPGLLLDLRAPPKPGTSISDPNLAHVKIQTSTVLVNGKQIQSIATGTPQLPVSELTVSLNSGKNNAVFVNRSDLCFQDKSTSKFRTLSTTYTYDGWNGAKTAGKIRPTVDGCGPGVSGKLSKAQNSKPRLSLTMQKHPDASSIKRLDIKLPNSLSFRKSKINKGAGGQTSATIKGNADFKVKGRSLDVSGLGAGGVKSVSILLRKGAVKLSTKSKRKLKRGKTLRFKITVTDTPVTGDKTSTTATLKVKGKKKHRHR